ncbi:ABC transporter permease [Methyloceanibacter sp.]|uniref:ABC transporter permease n=1 Tax=Methyloceanibacter sp. TaxID=1965321 RepID=UPI002C9373E1|nr:ABC transporter permease [Methyloceanibacter sp.]HML93217.1 ABC transporter permease [Methyloceanibacter sp.]
MSAAAQDSARPAGRDPGFLKRVWAMVVKEFVQMRRDRMTFATMLFIPILQLTLFGYAINTDPKHLPTAVLTRDDGPLTRAVLAAMKNSDYFAFTRQVRDPAELDAMLRSGAAQFAVEIPASFERDVRRGDRPSLLVIADATDPVATGTAIAAMQGLIDTALRRELRGPDAAVEARAPPFALTLQRRYNPEGLTQYNIVPGLLGVVLTMTMMMFTALAVTREIERGTMESLLAMPIRPVEIMIGKIAPFVLVGFVQMTIIIGAASYLFDVPIRGSVGLLVLLSTLFAAANLAVGYTFSTVAENQLQAVQMTFFFFLPNILLSGFMFPFRGMPQWAQVIGEILPLTHFMRIARGIMLKGNGLADMRLDVLALVIFLVAAMGLALLRFRRTLD